MLQVFFLDLDLRRAAGKAFHWRSKSWIPWRAWQPIIQKHCHSSPYTNSPDIRKMCELLIHSHSQCCPFCWVTFILSYTASSEVTDVCSWVLFPLNFQTLPSNIWYPPFPQLLTEILCQTLHAAAGAPCDGLEHRAWCGNQDVWVLLWGLSLFWKSHPQSIKGFQINSVSVYLKIWPSLRKPLRNRPWSSNCQHSETCLSNGSSLPFLNYQPNLSLCSDINIGRSIVE